MAAGQAANGIVGAARSGAALFRGTTRTPRFKGSGRKRRAPSRARRVSRRPTRRGRRVFQRVRRVKRRRGPFSVKTTARSRMVARLNMANPDKHHFHQFEQFSNLGSSANKKVCMWFSSNSDLPYTSMDPVFWKAMAFTYQPANDPPQQNMYQTNFSAAHRITNMGNAPILVTGHLIEARMDQPNLAGANVVRFMLGQGFASRAIDTANPNASNAGLTEDDYNIYNTGSFLSFFKVKKISRRNVMPGFSTVFSLRDTADYEVNVRKWLNIASGQNYNTAALNYVWTRGEQCWLFKVAPTQVADVTALTTSMAYGPCKVDVESDFRYSTCSIGGFGESLIQHTTTGLTAVGGGVQMVQVQAGSVQGQTVA